MLRMEMRDIRRQKNGWQPMPIFFEVMYLSAKSEKLASALLFK